MEFLKKLFEEGALDFDQFCEAAKKAGLKLADLSSGKYVSKAKYEDDLKAKDLQIEELNGTITQRDTDLSDLKTKLDKAGENDGKLSTLSTELSTLQEKYKADMDEYQSKLSKQAYEFAVKEFAATKEFTSNAAKRDFIQSMIKSELKMDDKGIIGTEDFTKRYMDENSDAFKVEEPKPELKQEQPIPQFIPPNQQTQPQENSNPFKFNFTGVRKKEE